MKREFLELVEAVRSLGIRLTGKPAPKCVRLADPPNFVQRLEDVQRALEALDASGALAGDHEIPAPEPKDDPKRLREALDKVMRLYQIAGGNLQDLDQVVRASLGLGPAEEEAKKGKEHNTLPAFAPARLKRKKGYRPRLNVYPDRPGEASFNDLRKIVYDLNSTSAILGATVPKNEQAFRRMQEKKFPDPPPAPPAPAARP